ncbi:MAG: electron transfer flavoprotein subunit beta/FixA family protein [Elusimicrobiota bacterium]|jgi:electron transfer flavoprotein beta subunit|nr:electron transfer flavoprotein subunit beta/FixA family protein [Elusimicrobiota bacterium]
MNIIVCIKQVPNTTDVKIDSETGRLKREGVESIVNPFDEYAIEEAVRLKEKNPGSKVTVITMGPPQAESVLRDALSKGADEGVLVCDRAFGGADTLATAYALSMAIKHLGNFDVIFCGKQATDGDTAQVGPGIAEMLDIAHVAYVKKINNISDKSITVERLMEDGYDVIESSLPVLMTVVKEINIPRLPSLKGKINSKKAVIKTLTAVDIGADEKRIGLNGSPTQVKKVFTPTQKTVEGEKFVGEPDVVASAIVAKFQEIGIV